MLDYDLVTSKARYRLPTRDDMPALLRLVGESAAERSAGKQRSIDQIVRTVRQLSKRPDRGSIFLFERNEELVGYCVLVTHWSNAHGGDVLRIDELYLDRHHRDDGIAEDFLRLLSQVAPKGTCAILIDASPRDRKIMSLCASAGFEACGERIMIRRVGDVSTADDA